jgi:hypothetical protein
MGKSGLDVEAGMVVIALLRLSVNVFYQSPGHTSPRATPPKRVKRNAINQQWDYNHALNHLKKMLVSFLQLNLSIKNA